MAQGFGSVAVEIETSADEAAIVRVLDDVLVNTWKGRRADDSGALPTYRTGSEAALRIWGVYSVRGARRFPLIVSAHVVDSDGRRLTLTFTGDEGPFLIYPVRAHRLWRANVDLLTARISQRLAGAIG